MKTLIAAAADRNGHVERKPFYSSRQQLALLRARLAGVLEMLRADVTEEELEAVYVEVQQLPRMLVEIQSTRTYVEGRQS